MATRKTNPSRKAAASRSTSQAYQRRAGKSIRAAIDDFLLDRESRNFSPKTLVQHRTSLTHLANFLETQHQVTHISMIEAVHLRAWLVFLAKEPGVRGKSRIPRTTRTWDMTRIRDFEGHLRPFFFFRRFHLFRSFHNQKFEQLFLKRANIVLLSKANAQLTQKERAS